MPVLTSLQSTDNVGNLLTSLHKEASRLDIKKYHKFLEAGLECDEYLEVLNNIQTLMQIYTKVGDYMQ